MRALKISAGKIILGAAAFAFGALISLPSAMAAPGTTGAEGVQNMLKQFEDPRFVAGAKIYGETCAACHDAGMNRAPQRIMLQGMRPETILRALTDGAMREQARALSAGQKASVAEYLAGRMIGSGPAQAAMKMCMGRHAGFDRNAPPAFTGWGLDAASTHAIPAAVSGLNKGNAGRLKLKWAFGFPDSQRMRSEPAVAGGAIVVGNHNGSVYALDGETGCVRWKFDAQAEVRTGIVIAPWRAGDRKARSLTYFGDNAGIAYAVDSFTGKLAWKVKVDSHPAALLTGTPTLHNGTLYVPVSSVEEAFATSPGYVCCSFRGSVLALDAATGRQRWRAYLVNAATARGTNANGLERLGPSGAAVWNSPSIDVKRGQLYVATGDNYSLPNSDMSDAIVAIDLRTGKINWHYQALAGDTWNVDCYTKTGGNCPDERAPDFDFGAGTVLAKASDGRELVLAGQKSGWVYGLDPASGKLAWRTRVGRGGMIGGVHFGMAADKGRLFVPISDQFADGPGDVPARPGVYALDIATGEFRWKAPSVDVCAGRKFCNPGYGGSLTATGGVVLIGGDDGHVRIFDAADGKILWDRDTTVDVATVNGVPGHGGSISGGAAPIAYRGHLIVSSGYGFASKMGGNVLLVYGIE